MRPSPTSTARPRREDLTLLYFTGHGVKDDEGRLYLAMTNTRREALMFTAISGAQLNDAMDASRSRRKVLILDCCYSGAFPAGRTAKADEGMQTLERFQGKGRAVLTASDATQYAFEGDDLRGSGTSSVFTRYLVEAISTGAADLDEDGDIALDELYSYVYDRVVAEVPQQRPKKQEDVDGRILIARNVHWKLPAHLQHAIESPISAQRLTAVQELGYLYGAGNDVVRTAVDSLPRHTRVRRQPGGLVGGHGAAGADRAVDGRPGGRRPAAGPAPRPAPRSRTWSPGARVPPTPVSPSRVPPAAPGPGRTRASPCGRGSPVGPPASGCRKSPVRVLSSLVLGLVVLSALPLTLSRLLSFETTYPYTAAQFGSSTVAWTLAVVAPLTVAPCCWRCGSRLPRALPPASGLVLGAALVLTETSAFWVAFFNQNRNYGKGRRCGGCSSAGPWWRRPRSSS